MVASILISEYILVVAHAAADKGCPIWAKSRGRRRGMVLGSSRLAFATVMGDVAVGQSGDRESKKKTNVVNDEHKDLQEVEEIEFQSKIITRIELNQRFPVTTRI